MSTNDYPGTGDHSSNINEPSGAERLQSADLQQQYKRVSHGQLSPAQATQNEATEESASESDLEGMEECCCEEEEEEQDTLYMDQEEHLTPSHLGAAAGQYSDSEGSSLEDADVSLTRSGPCGTPSGQAASSSSNFGCSVSLSSDHGRRYSDSPQKSNGRKGHSLTFSEYKATALLAAEAQKQKKHNQNERIRRKSLRESVQMLRAQLRRRRTKRSTTIRVLKAAIEEITELKEVERKEEKEMETLKKHQSHLTWRLEKLVSEFNVSTSPSPSCPPVPPTAPPAAAALVVPPFLPAAAASANIGAVHPSGPLVIGIPPSPFSPHRFHPYPAAPASLSSTIPPGGHLRFPVPQIPFPFLPLTPSHMAFSPLSHSSTADLRPTSPLNLAMSFYPRLYPGVGLSRFSAPHFSAYPLGPLGPLSGSGTPNQLLSSSNASDLPMFPSVLNLIPSSQSSTVSPSARHSRADHHDRSDEGDEAHSPRGEESMGSNSEHEHQRTHRHHEEEGFTQQEEKTGPKNGVVSAEPFLHLRVAAAQDQGTSVKSSTAARGSAEVNSTGDVEAELQRGRERMDRSVQQSTTPVRSSGVAVTTEYVGTSKNVSHCFSQAHSATRTVHKVTEGQHRQQQSSIIGPPPLLKIDSKAERCDQHRVVYEPEQLFETPGSLPSPPLLKRDREDQQGRRSELHNGDSASCRDSMEQQLVEQRKRHRRYSLKFRSESCPIGREESSKFKFEITSYCKSLTNESQYR